MDLMGAVHACEIVITWMTEAGKRVILLVSSTSGLESDPMSDYGYTAAKEAPITYAKNWPPFWLRGGFGLVKLLLARSSFRVESGLILKNTS